MFSSASSSGSNIIFAAGCTCTPSQRRPSRPSWRSVILPISTHMPPTTQSPSSSNNSNLHPLSILISPLSPTTPASSHHILSYPCVPPHRPPQSTPIFICLTDYANRTRVEPVAALEGVAGNVDPVPGGVSPPPDPPELDPKVLPDRTLLATLEAALLSPETRLVPAEESLLPIEERVERDDQPERPETFVWFVFGVFG